MQPEKVWRVVGSSVRGTSHAATGLPCQDAHAWRTPRRGLLIAAAADGAGSAKESQTGARLACDAALDSLARNQDLRAAAAAARAGVLAEAERLQLPPRELACTLMLLVATPAGASALQIGDGAVLVLAESGDLRALTAPAESEYLNETDFLTGPGALDGLQTAEFGERVRGAALFTDGLQMLTLKMPERAPHQPFFNPLFRFVQNEPDAKNRQEQIDKFLRSPRVAQRADDDLTLLLALLS